MMKLSKALRAAEQEARKTDAYWVDRAKLGFTVALERRRKSSDMTYAAIAEKLGKSPAYVSQVFRGDGNLTIETMVKLAKATGGELSIQVVSPAAATEQAMNWARMIVAQPAAAPNDGDWFTTKSEINVADHRKAPALELVARYG